MGQLVVVERKRGREIVLRYRLRVQRGASHGVAVLTSVTVDGVRVRRDKEPGRFREIVRAYELDEMITVRVVGAWG